MELPMDQLWFNILLRALITVYCANGIWSFVAFIPWMSKEDAEILGYDKNSNYSFQLTSSLIFCLLWIAQFRYQFLVYITLIEIIIVVVTYLNLIECKLRYLRKKRETLKKIKKNGKDEIRLKVS